jgi:hypothetical protein
MIEINFYKHYPTTWEELQQMALDVIKNLEAEADDSDAEKNGDLPDTLVNGDYRKAIESGLKTFTFDVLNEWGYMNLILSDGKFWKKETHIEIENLFKDLDRNLFKTPIELLNKFKSESVKLSTDEYDLIMDNFESDVVAMVYSYEIKFIDLDDYEEDDDDDDDDI